MDFEYIASTLLEIEGYAEKARFASAVAENLRSKRALLLQKDRDALTNAVFAILKAILIDIKNAESYKEKYDIFDCESALMGITAFLYPDDMDTPEYRAGMLKNCRIAATHNDYDETYAAVRAALQEDSSLSYIYMANRSVPASVKAIEDTGMAGRVRILSHDCNPEISRFLREGKVDFTIDQDLAYQTYQSLTLLLRCLSEHKLPEQDAYCPPSPILTAELA